MPIHRELRNSHVWLMQWACQKAFLWGNDHGWAIITGYVLRRLPTALRYSIWQCCRGEGRQQMPRHKEERKHTRHSVLFSAQHERLRIKKGLSDEEWLRLMPDNFCWHSLHHSILGQGCSSTRALEHNSKWALDRHLQKDAPDNRPG